jgi:hypothetical protein
MVFIRKKKKKEKRFGWARKLKKKKEKKKRTERIYYENSDFLLELMTLERARQRQTTEPDELSSDNWQRSKERK